MFSRPVSLVLQKGIVGILVCFMEYTVVCAAMVLGFAYHLPLLFMYKELRRSLTIYLIY